MTYPDGVVAYPDRGVAQAFLWEHLAAADASDGAKRYRFEHCLRVAKIGRVVAERAFLDAELLELGCLLHDVGKYDAEVPVDHGRAGALVVRDWFDEVGFRGAAADEVVQGIAMHVDGLFNPREDDQGSGRNAAGVEYLRFKRPPGPVAASIADCDNIDRFGAYRIADTLAYVQFMEKSTDEQREFIEGYLENLRGLYDYECSTDAAQDLWTDRLDFQQEYFVRLLGEIR